MFYHCLLNIFGNMTKASESTKLIFLPMFFSFVSLETNIILVPIKPPMFLACQLKEIQRCYVVYCFFFCRLWSISLMTMTRLPSSHKPPLSRMWARTCLWGQRFYASQWRTLTPPRGHRLWQFLAETMETMLSTVRQVNRHIPWSVIQKFLKWKCFPFANIYPILKLSVVKVIS